MATGLISNLQVKSWLGLVAKRRWVNGLVVVVPVLVLLGLWSAGWLGHDELVDVEDRDGCLGSIGDAPVLGQVEVVDGFLVGVNHLGFQLASMEKWSRPPSFKFKVVWSQLSYRDVESGCGLAFLMGSVQLGQNFGALQARVLGQGSWNDLKGLRKLLDGVLLQAWKCLRNQSGRLRKDLWATR